MPPKMKLDKGQKRLFETLVFLLKVLAFAIPLYLIMHFQNVLFPLQELVSQNVQAVLQAFGFTVSRDGFLIRANDTFFFISEDCTGWKSMLLLTALICAVPRVVMKKRLAGLAGGVAALYIGNLARILLMILAWQAYGFAFAIMLHNYMWQAGLISLVLVIWFLWLAWTGKLEKTLLKRLHKLIKPRDRKKPKEEMKRWKR